MNNYKAPDQKSWTGRNADERLYWHQYVQCINLEQDTPENGVAILSYAVDEGVRRNQGRVGVADGPEAIVQQLSKLSYHHSPSTQVYDVGTFYCEGEQLEDAHNEVSKAVKLLLDNGCTPVILGGGHDLAYAHYNGIKAHFNSTEAKIGIINLDAHFDLRAIETIRNSGTPFYQIATEANAEGSSINYLCLGIQSPANNKELYNTAEQHGVRFMEMQDFQLSNWNNIQAELWSFINDVDKIYLTLDMDGFSSAYAPGVSAPSPMGFEPQLILKVIDEIIKSQKLISMDVVELNPAFDIDGATARLAARMVDYALSQIYSP